MSIYIYLAALLSAVAVFIVSSVIHMASPWHKNDYQRLDREDDFRKSVGPLAIPPGDYMVPRPVVRGEMRSPEFKAKHKEGPVVIMTVLPNGNWNMGRNLTLWFLYILAVSLISGFVAYHAAGPMGDHHRVFHFVAVLAFLSYCAGLWQLSIWYRRKWRTTFAHTVDAFVYAVITGLIFVWLWR